MRELYTFGKWEAFPRYVRQNKRKLMIKDYGFRVDFNGVYFAFTAPARTRGGCNGIILIYGITGMGISGPFVTSSKEDAVINFLSIATRKKIPLKQMAEYARKREPIAAAKVAKWREKFERESTNA
jgi:hypothetical protein